MPLEGQLLLDRPLSPAPLRAGGSRHLQPLIFRDLDDMSRSVHDEGPGQADALTGKTPQTSRQQPEDP